MARTRATARRGLLERAVTGCDGERKVQKRVMNMQDPKYFRHPEPITSIITFFAINRSRRQDGLRVQGGLEVGTSCGSSFGGVEREIEGIDLVAHDAAAVENLATLPVLAVVREHLDRRRQALGARQLLQIARALRQPVDGDVGRELQLGPPERVVPRRHRVRPRPPHHHPHLLVEVLGVGRVLHVDENGGHAGVGLPHEVLVVVAHEAVVVPDPAIGLARACGGGELFRRVREARRTVLRADVASALREAVDYTGAYARGSGRKATDGGPRDEVGEDVVDVGLGLLALKALAAVLSDGVSSSSR
ncbi:hypothetical protein B296_00051625 [Ensete ventricosum]|uniref:Uncharacterized protein n=1 Tax=Ensete ventricosum TaxID=4639 RepID=A0A426X960_ENSVE|nr:hypothetical protein B296_00051625 [Ensete ventricosum]